MAEYHALTGLIRWFRGECEVCSASDSDFDPTDYGHADGSQRVADDGSQRVADDGSQRVAGGDGAADDGSQRVAGGDGATGHGSQRVASDDDDAELEAMIE